MNFGPQFVLLVPVCQGGILFERCLRSVTKSQELFDLIVFSLNGDFGGDDRLRILAAGLEMSRVAVLETTRVLPPARHLAWAIRSMQTMVQRDDHVMLLAHDDEVYDSGLVEWCSNRPPDWSRRAWIGDYLYVDDEANRLERTIVAIPDSQPLPIRMSEWLAVNMADPRGHVFTNLSGSSTSFHALMQVARFLSVTRMTKGARIEFILVASPANRGIDRRSPPAVVVHNHSQQGGKFVSAVDRQLDEARYCLWLLIRAASVRELVSVLRSPWGPRRFLWSLARGTKAALVSRPRQASVPSRSRFWGWWLG